MTSTPPTVAIYARVSTEDQAERETVKAQLDFLRKYCDLHQLPVAGEYVDDGISGTVPLDQRPEGRRLLDDAGAGRFSVVLVYRLDRLGRSLTALLAAHEALDRASVAIRSATEPFDTASPIGKFLFQLLGSLAELERSTIQERMTMGRDRVAKSGRYVGGFTPMGYDVEPEGQIVQSARILPGVGMTESDLIRDIFAHVAGGATLQGEVKRLTALGVVPVKRYGNGAVKEGSNWSVSRLWDTVKNPTYKGAGALQSRNGAVSRPIPALVDEATWDAAQAALTRNRKLSTKNAQRTYLLRGLIRCGNCGLGFCGRTSGGASGREVSHYQCAGALAALRPDRDERCRSRNVNGAWLESLIWEDCKAWIFNPGERLAEAQRQLRERMARSVGSEEQIRALLHEIAQKEGERERVLTMYRRGRITMDEADQQLDEITQETASIRQLLDGIRSQEALTAAAEEHLTNTASMLAQLRDRVEEIDRTDDRAAKREIIDLLISRITVDTEPGEFRKHKRATVAITYAFSEPRIESVASGKESHAGSGSRRTSRPRSRS